MIRSLWLLTLSLLSTAVFSQPLKLILPIGHTGSINDVRILNGGEKIVTVSSDNSARIWSAYDQRLLAIYEADEEISKVFEVPQANAIIACASTGIATMWSTVRDSLIHTFTPPFYENALYLEFASADLTKRGDLFAIGFRSGGVAVWHIPSRTLKFQKKLSAWTTIRFTPDGKSLLASAYNGEMILLDTESGDIINTYTGNKEKIKDLAFDSEGKRFVTGGGLSELLIWDVATGQILNHLSGRHTQHFKFNNKRTHTTIDNNYFINDVSFDHSGNFILSASDDGSAILWDAQTGKGLIELPHGDGNINHASFNEDGSLVLTSSFDSTRLWNSKNGILIHTWDGSKGQFQAENDHISFVRDFTMAGNYSFVVADPVSGLESVPELPASNGIASAALAGEKRIYTRMNDSRLYSWNLAHATLEPIPGRTDEVTIASLSSSGKLLAIGHYDSTAGLLRTDDHTYIPLKNVPGRFYMIRFNHDESLIAGNFLKSVLSIDSTVAIWDTRNGGMLSTKKFESAVTRVFFFPGTSVLYVILANGVYYAYNDPADMHPSQQGILAYDSDDTEISPDGNYFYLRGDSLRVIRLGDEAKLVWQSRVYQTDRVDFSKMNDILFLENEIVNLADSTVKAKIPEYSDEYFTDDSLRFLIITTTSGYNDTVQVFDMERGILLYNFRPHENEITDIVFSPDASSFYTFSEDNMFKKWDTRSGQLIFESFAGDNENYFTRIPAGYYQATASAARKLHYVTPDLDVISFEQLDVRYNRPDKVLQAIGSKDTLLIRSYRKAWEKRIRQLGMDTSQFRETINLPHAEIAGRRSIRFQQAGKMLTLHIKGSDDQEALDRMNIWVNDVPLFGQRGIILRDRRIGTIDTVFNIELSKGLNRIETSVTNISGTESYRKPLLVSYTPRVKPSEKLYFIGIGIDEFLDSRHNLMYSSEDIRDLVAAFKSRYGQEVIVDTLFNRSVTREAVKSLKKKLLEASVDDRIIIAYSGHGLLSRNFDYFLSTWSVNFDKPEDNGLPYEELESLLDGIRARKKLMLIDACHSGEVDKEDLTLLEETTDRNIKGLKPVAYKKEGQIGLQNSFELMQSIFVNVGKNTGATIISAAAGTQFALERGDLRNGVFTYSILHAMASRTNLKVSDLKKIVIKKVSELTQGLQRPTSRSENISTDWNLF